MTNNQRCGALDPKGNACVLEPGHAKMHYAGFGFHWNGGTAPKVAKKPKSKPIEAVSHPKSDPFAPPSTETPISPAPFSAEAKPKCGSTHADAPGGCVLFPKHAGPHFTMVVGPPSEAFAWRDAGDEVNQWYVCGELWSTQNSDKGPTKKPKAEKMQVCQRPCEHDGPHRGLDTVIGNHMAEWEGDGPGGTYHPKTKLDFVASVLGANVAQVATAPCGDTLAGHTCTDDADHHGDHVAEGAEWSRDHTSARFDEVPERDERESRPDIEVIVCAEPATEVNLSEAAITLGEPHEFEEAGGHGIGAVLPYDERTEAHSREPGQQSTALAKIEEQPEMLSVERAREFLAKSKSVDEVRDVADKAKAVSLYLRSRDASIESQNDAAEIRLRAERRLGELTAELEKNKGGRPEKASKKAPEKTGNDARPVSAPTPMTLAEQGIKKQDAAKWQQIAKIPEKKFEKVIADTKAKGQRLTANAPLKMIRQEKKADLAAELRAKPVPQATGRFNVIVIDPPWMHDKRAEDITQRGQGDYPRMEIEEIKALPVADRAEENCILWCWVTNQHMRQAYECLDAWGFVEKSILTWGKDHFGNGDWLRGQTEHCILAVKGSPIVTLTNQSTLLEGKKREHSRKPDEFYALVEALCPGTKLEMFAREPHNDQWQVWGNETDKFSTEAA